MVVMELLAGRRLTAAFAICLSGSLAVGFTSMTETVISPVLAQTTSGQDRAVTTDDNVIVFPAPADQSGPRDLTQITLEATPPSAAGQQNAEQQTQAPAVAPATGKPATGAAGSNEAGLISGTATSSSLNRRDPVALRLSALGLDLGPIGGLDDQAWQGTNVSDAITLLTALPSTSASPTLQQLMHHVVLSRSVPPQGASAAADALVAARLAWLIRGNHSNDLAALVRQLPTGGAWESWQRWLVSHDLLVRNDEEACAITRDQAGRSLDLFWHKIRVFCQLMEEDEMGTRFAVDVLEASGLDDAGFIALIRRLLGDNALASIDQENVSLLHLALMDAAHMVIEPEALTALPPGHADGLSRLRYLSVDARRWLSGMAWQQQRLEAAMLAEELASMPAPVITTETALGRLENASDAETIGISRITAWQAIAAEPDSLEAARQALRGLSLDLGHGGGLNSLELWLPLIRPAVADPLLADEVRLLLALGRSPEAAADETPADLDETPDETAAETAATTSAAAWRQLMDFVGSAAAEPVPAPDFSLISQLGLDEAMPLLQSLGYDRQEIQGLAEILRDSPEMPSYQPLPRAGLAALQAAAEAGRTAETILLAAVLTADRPLAGIMPMDAAVLVDGLAKAGLKEEAVALGREFLTAIMLARWNHASG